MAADLVSIQLTASMNNSKAGGEDPLLTHRLRVQTSVVEALMH